MNKKETQVTEVKQTHTAKEKLKTVKGQKIYIKLK